MNRVAPLPVRPFKRAEDCNVLFLRKEKMKIEIIVYQLLSGKYVIEVEIVQNLKVSTFR